MAELRQEGDMYVDFWVCGLGPGGWSHCSLKYRKSETQEEADLDVQTGWERAEEVRSWVWASLLWST